MLTSTNPSNGDPLFPLSMVEYRAANDPDGVWARIPASETSYNNGFTGITYAELQNAVDGMAGWLKTATRRKPGDTISYFGPWDPRYVLMVLGACKAGYRMVFPTPLFTPQVLDRLVMQKLDCKTVITASGPIPQLVSEFVCRNSLQHLSCPSLSRFLYETHEHTPCKRYKEAADDVLAIMYTSGSSADAKPIIWTNSFAASFLRQSVMEPPPGWESVDRATYAQGADVINILPVLHCGSMFTHLFSVPLYKCIAHYPLPGSLRCPETFMELLEHVDAGKIHTAIMPPASAEYIAADAARTAKVARKLSTLAYAGGCISNAAGEILSHAMNTFSLFACTENGVYPMIRPKGAWDPQRWKTIHFHPSGGLRLDKVGSASYEVVVERPADSSPHDPNLSPALKSFPCLNVWRSEDVFTPDPAEDGSWIYSRRVSDMITYTDGTTFNPLPYEQYLRSHPAISAALLFGRERPNAVILLEPAAEYNRPEQDQAQFIQLIWSHIEEANSLANGQCNVEKSQIVVACPGKEIPQATKGTIQRGKARALYQLELTAATRASRGRDTSE